MINDVINNLLDGSIPSETQLRECFDEIFSGLADDVRISSFISLLNDLNFSQNVLLSAILASNNQLKNKVNLNIDSIENISFVNSFGCVDISLLQDLICSAGDLCACKYSFNSPLCVNNSFKILELLGFNFEKEIDYNSCEFEKLNFNYVYLSNEVPYFKYAEPIRAKLPFKNVFSYVLKMLNPFSSKNLFLGVSDRDFANTMANVALKLNKENSIIVSSDNDFGYIYPNGETYIAEAWKNKIFTYVITPELLGFDSAQISEIEVENNEQNASDILNIIENKDCGAKYSMAIMNSALSLYISKKAESLIDGVNLAKNLISSGKVKEKFEQLKNFYS